MYISCPHCGVSLQITAEMQGTSAPCPKCGSWFSIGGMSETAEQPPMRIEVEPPPLPVKRRAPEPKSNAVQNWLVVGMVGWTGLLVLYLIYQSLSVLPYLNEKWLPQLLVWIYVQALFVYSVPMIALVLGYIAAKR